MLTLVLKLFQNLPTPLSRNRGERNRLQLAKSLKEGCNVLILDEPTNDLDVDTLRKLEESILKFRRSKGGAAVIVSHDRFFLDRVCTGILAFSDVAGESPFYFHGTFSEFEQNKAKQMPSGWTPKSMKHKKLPTF